MKKECDAIGGRRLYFEIPLGTDRGIGKGGEKREPKNPCDPIAYRGA